MELGITWHDPIDLLNGDECDLIYTANGLEEWLDVAGVYMFARIYDKKVIPLYIGKSENLGKRATQHFKSSTKLMTSIKKARNGTKVLIFGEFTSKSKKDKKEKIAHIERALIDHALNLGFNLFNVQGAKGLLDKVSFTGYSGAKKVTGASLSFKAKA